MKSRFTTIDLKAALAEINKSAAIGLRVMNVYDIDNKTYLIRLVHGETKIVILIESGNRIHLTEYDWPKNMMPSGFSMKCRKHLKGRRLASVSQLGVDRIVDFTFGYDEAAYHFIVELYDRGNIILTDYEYNILQLLRVRADTDKDVKFAVKEKYPVDLAKQHEGIPSKERVLEMFNGAKPGENIKRILNPNFIYGPALLEHALLSVGLKPNAKVPQQLNMDPENLSKLMSALNNAENILQSIDDLTQGYIIQKSEKKPKTEETVNTNEDELLTFAEFHPFLYQQHSKSPRLEFSSFNKCVDEFFSKLESQKIDMKAISMEKSALKRLENVKEDHKKRLEALKTSQDFDTRKAELIEMNLPLVEKAIATINSAIANQIDWEEIEEIVKEAQSQLDPVASIIKSLKLNTNQIVLSLRDVFDERDESSDDNDPDDAENAKGKEKKPANKVIDINIDLSLTAFANARGFHTKRRQAASKEGKTIQASKKALKSAEQKTKETLKEVQTAKLISKTRKANWFEKFYWFISSENYLIVGGRDQQQNELLVKRYLRPGDLYVHADLHGASSVIVINAGKGEIPPKTLNEAGTMAICYSAAWEARVVTSAWWVYHNQVSKTAPSGEYLTTGSFMIRGKKNYLPPSQLVMGFSVMFKLEEASICNHTNDRKVRTLEEDVRTQESASVMEESEQEIPIDIGDDTEDTSSPQSENAEDISKSMKEEDLEEEVSSPQSDLSEENDGSGQENTGESCDLTQQIENLKVEPKEEEEESEDEEFDYPDTNIQLQHVTGDVYQMHRGTSTYSNEGKSSLDDENTKTADKLDENRKPKLSAKQRRDMKKKKKQQEGGEKIQENTNEEVQNVKKEISKSPPAQVKSQHKNNNPPQQPVQLTRGQKKKMKRMKDKYKDQDEEDREMMQQILKSSGAEKPPKRKNKAMKNLHQNTGITKQQQKIKRSTMIPTDILHQEEAEIPSTNSAEVSKENEDDDEDDKVEGENNENKNILDSLTGQPVEDDVLLYTISVCAPYSCMQSYKYKVKVTPGSGKRGRAAKSAVKMFLQAKEATEWEKDLLKSLKDVDISRNMPGKVKISAPNLQRSKKK